MPLEPLLVDGAPEHDNSGRIARGSLAPIWECINRDLLPTMARDYVDKMKALIAADNQREARQVAATFQTKVVKYLENTFSSPDGVEQTRARLATYTAAHAAYGDLMKMLCVMRQRDALAKFNDALPASIEKFDATQISNVTKLLDAFGKKHAEALPSRWPWSPDGSGRHGTDSPRHPGSAQQECRRCRRHALCANGFDDAGPVGRQSIGTAHAAQNNRVQAAKDILIEIYDIEYALQTSIDLLNESPWGARLRDLMDAIAALVDEEVSRFPDNVGHVLKSRSLRRHQSLTGRLTHLAWKGRDASSMVQRSSSASLRHPADSKAACNRRPTRARVVTATFAARNNPETVTGRFKKREMAMARTRSQWAKSLTIKSLAVKSLIAIAMAGTLAFNSGAGAQTPTPAPRPKTRRRPPTTALCSRYF